MKPQLTLVGINRLRSAVGLFAGAFVLGLQVYGQSVEGSEALMDRTLMSVLWIYIGITAVPWANLKGMAGSSVTPTLVMGGWGVYIAGVVAATGWSVTQHPAFHEPQRLSGEEQCLADLNALRAATDGGVAGRPVVNPEPSSSGRAAEPPPQAAQTRPEQTPPVGAPSVTPPSTDAGPSPVAAPSVDASAATGATASPETTTDASIAEDASTATEDTGRRRRRRHRDEDPDEETGDPSVWLERDQPR